MLMTPYIRVFCTVNVHRKDGGKPDFENAQRKIRQSDAKFSLCFPKFLRDQKGFRPLPGGAVFGCSVKTSAPGPGAGGMVELDADSPRMFRLLGALVETGNQCWLWDRPYGRPNCLPHRELM